MREAKTKSHNIKSVNLQANKLQRSNQEFPTCKNDIFYLSAIFVCKLLITLREYEGARLFPLLHYFNHDQFYCSREFYLYFRTIVNVYYFKYSRTKNNIFLYKVKLQCQFSNATMFYSSPEKLYLQSVYSNVHKMLSYN